MKTFSLLCITVALAACATAHDPRTPDPMPPVAEPEPTPGTLFVRLEDYAECFVTRTADAMQGRLVLGPCPE